MKRTIQSSILYVMLHAVILRAVIILPIHHNVKRLQARGGQTKSALRVLTLQGVYIGSSNIRPDARLNLML